MKRNSYEFKDAGLSLIFLIIGYVLVSMLLSFLLNIVSSTSNTNWEMLVSQNWVIWLNAFLTELIYFLVFIIYSKAQKVDISSASCLNKKFEVKKGVKLSLTTILLTFVVFFASLNFINLISDLLARGLGDISGSVPLSNFFEFLMSTIFFALIPSIVEELLFRGLIFNSLKSKFNVTISVLLSALIFALIHFSIFQTVYQFLIGVVLALLVHFTGSIVFGMVFHFFNNFIILFISYFTQGNKSIFEFSNFGGLEIFLSILIFVLGVLVCVGIFYIIRKISRNTKNNEESLNTKQESSQIDTTNYILLGVGLFIAIFIWCVNSFGG